LIQMLQLFHRPLLAHRVISLRCGDLSAFGGVADMAGLCCWLDAFANDPKRHWLTSTQHAFQANPALPE